VPTLAVACPALVAAAAVQRPQPVRTATASPQRALPVTLDVLSARGIGLPDELRAAAARKRAPPFFGSTRRFDDDGYSFGFEARFGFAGGLFGFAAGFVAGFLTSLFFGV